MLDEAALEPPLRVSASGIATLAALPSGVLSGHFVDLATRACISILGRQVLSENVCYRDADWALCKLTLRSRGAPPGSSALPRTAGSGGGGAGLLPASAAIHGERGGSAGPSGPPAEAEAWVQRTGGDMIRLRPADLSDEPTAEAIGANALDLEYAGGEESALPAVRFEASSLLDGAAADEHLAAFQPGLVGRGAVVNIGQMTIGELPARFLAGAQAVPAVAASSPSDSW